MFDGRPGGPNGSALQHGVSSLLSFTRLINSWRRVHLLPRLINSWRQERLLGGRWCRHGASNCDFRSQWRRHLRFVDPRRLDCGTERPSLFIRRLRQVSDIALRGVQVERERRRALPLRHGRNRRPIAYRYTRSMQRYRQNDTGTGTGSYTAPTKHEKTTALSNLIASRRPSIMYNHVHGIYDNRLPPSVGGGTRKEEAVALSQRAC